MIGSIEHEMWRYFKSHYKTEFESKDVESWLAAKSCGRMLFGFDIKPAVKKTIKRLEKARYIEKIDDDRWRLI